MNEPGTKRPARRQEPRVAALYRTLVGVGAACGLLVVGAHELTAERVERGRARARERAILQVLPGASRFRSFERDEQGAFAPIADERASGAAGERAHAGYDSAGTLVGLAVEARGTGYQDTIRLLYGYSPTDAAIVGLAVLESRETPGLGDAIESAEFSKNFQRLDVTLSPDGSRLSHPITIAGRGAQPEPWQVDAISGATVSSKAVTRIVGQSAARWVPELARRRKDFSP